MVDRSLSTNVFNNFTSICRITSSLIYSILRLDSLIFCTLFSLVVVSLFYGFGQLFRQTMTMRRNIFRR